MVTQLPKSHPCSCTQSLTHIVPVRDPFTDLLSWALVGIISLYVAALFVPSHFCIPWKVIAIMKAHSIIFRFHTGGDGWDINTVMFWCSLKRENPEFPIQSIQIIPNANTWEARISAHPSTEQHSQPIKHKCGRRIQLSSAKPDIQMT